MNDITEFPKNDHGVRANMVFTLPSGPVVPFWDIAEWSHLVEGRVYLVLPKTDVSNLAMQLLYPDQELSVSEWEEVAKTVLNELKSTHAGVIKIIFNTGNEFKFEHVVGARGSNIFTYNGIVCDNRDGSIQ